MQKSKLFSQESETAEVAAANLWKKGLGMAEVADLIFSARVEEIRKLFLPRYLMIERARQWHPKREVGGRIIGGQVRFLDSSKCHAHSVSCGNYEEKRREREEGKLFFHTHRDAVKDPGPSINDLACAAASGGEMLVNKEGAFLLIPEEKLSFEKISKLREAAKLEEVVFGNLDWEGLELNLSVRVIKLAPSLGIKESNFHKWYRRLVEKLS